jgi:hypothetical protein
MLPQKEFEIDKRWLLFKVRVWERDAGTWFGSSKSKKWKNYCTFWRCLSHEERVLFQSNFKESLWLCRTLDVAHILPRSTHPQLTYEIDNVTLVNRLAHNLLDTYKCPLTSDKISEQDRYDWMVRIKESSFENADRGKD